MEILQYGASLFNVLLFVEESCVPDSWDEDQGDGMNASGMGINLAMNAMVSDVCQTS